MNFATAFGNMVNAATTNVNFSGISQSLKFEIETDFLPEDVCEPEHVFNIHNFEESGCFQLRAVDVENSPLMTHTGLKMTVPESIIVVF